MRFFHNAILANSMAGSGSSSGVLWGPFESAGPNAYSFQTPVHTTKVVVSDGNIVTLQTAINNATAGTWIALSGTYNGKIDLNGKNGSSSNPITIQPEALHGAKIIGGSLDCSVFFRNCSYVHVIGLDLDGGGSGGTNTVVGIGSRYGNYNGSDSSGGSVSNSKLIACKVHNSRQEGFKINWLSEFIEVAYNEIYDLGLGNASLGEAVYIGSWNNSTGNDTTNNIDVHHNWLHDVPADGIDIKPTCRDIFIRQNLFDQLVIPDTGGSTAIPLGAITVGGQRVTVEYNRVVGVAHTGANADAEGNGITLWVPGIVRYNLIVNTDRFGIQMRGSYITTSQSATDFAGQIYDVHNNVMYNHGIGDESGVGITKEDSLGGFTLSCENNVATLLGISTGTNYATPSGSDFLGPLLGSADSGTGTGSGFLLSAGTLVPTGKGFY